MCNPKRCNVKEEYYRVGGDFLFYRTVGFNVVDMAGGWQTTEGDCGCHPYTCLPLYRILIETLPLKEARDYTVLQL